MFDCKNTAQSSSDYLKNPVMYVILIVSNTVKGTNAMRFLNMKSINRNIYAAMFGSFMFFQLAVLGLGNHAGEGLLSDSSREQIYYGIQLPVILGYIGYAVFERYLKRETVKKYTFAAVFTVLAAGSLIMALADKAAYLYVSVTFSVMPALGFLGGAVYHRMSIEAASGVMIARRMGIGCAAAVALQYLLQLGWGETPLLPVFMLAALVLTCFAIQKKPEILPDKIIEKPSSRSLLYSCLTASVFLLFIGFYNSYIHHLQIQSGYIEFNVYSWPRLMMIPCYLLFAFIGDKRQGRLVPVTALCMSLTAMLNSVLTGSADVYDLNMCLFYCAVAASVAYYDLEFWRLAQGTKHPAFWASTGRVLDSAMVLICAGCRVSKLGASAVLAVNIICLAVLILVMTVSGGFNITDLKEQKLSSSLLSPESTFDLIKQKYSLTPRETDVFRELVLTEDKQTAISGRLSISVKMLQKYVTSIYKKTGTETRSGLSELYRRTMIGE